MVGLRGLGLGYGQVEIDTDIIGRQSDGIHTAGVYGRTSSVSIGGRVARSSESGGVLGHDSQTSREGMIGRRSSVEKDS